MGRETYFPQLAILVPERQSCACLRGQYTLRKIITRHSNHVPRLNLHSPAAPPVPHFPRFRALALFGRRPPQRVDSLVMPASENLHNNGSRQPCLMTSSASCRRATFKTVTNEPSRKSFRVDSDRGVAALQLQGGHLRPGAHNLQTAARAAFAQSAEAAPTIAGGYVPALRALRPIVRDKRAIPRFALLHARFLEPPRRGGSRSARYPTGGPAHIRNDRERNSDRER